MEPPHWLVLPEIQAWCSEHEKSFFLITQIINLQNKKLFVNDRFTGCLKYSMSRIGWMKANWLAWGRQETFAIAVRSLSPKGFECHCRRVRQNRHQMHWLNQLRPSLHHHVHQHRSPTKMSSREAVGYLKNRSVSSTTYRLCHSLVPWNVSISRKFNVIKKQTSFDTNLHPKEEFFVGAFEFH